MTSTEWAIQDSGTRSAVEDVFLPFTADSSYPEDYELDKIFELVVDRVKALKESNPEKYRAIIDSLKLLLLLPTKESKFEHISSLSSLSMGFGFIPENAQINDEDDNITRYVKIAEAIAIKVLNALEEEIQE